MVRKPGLAVNMSFLWLLTEVGVLVISSGIAGVEVDMIGTGYERIMGQIQQRKN
jgi:hypothetical protein